MGNRTDGRPSTHHPKGLRGDSDTTEELKKKGLGINGLMRAFGTKKRFSGSWDEDLDDTISIFETLSNICELSDEEKLKAIPIMLMGDAMSYFSNKAKTYDTYEDAMITLRKWYNSDDKKARILTKWQTMSLSKEMADSRWMVNTIRLKP